VSVERLGLTQPEPVDRHVADDREEPGQHGPTACVVAGRITPGAQEGLLGHVLGLAAVADDRSREAVRTPLEAAHEGCGRIAVAGRKAREQGLVGALHTLIYHRDGLEGLRLEQVRTAWSARAAMRLRSTRTCGLETRRRVREASLAQLRLTPPTQA
jgi:hypothetical protein